MWNQRLLNVLGRYVLILCFLIKYIRTYHDNTKTWKGIIQNLANKVDDIFDDYKRHEDAYAGKFFKYTLPKDIDDKDEYEAYEEGKTELPRWLSFESRKRKLHGIPTDEDIRLGIKIVFRRKHENTVNGLIGESKFIVINVNNNRDPFTCDYYNEKKGSQVDYSKGVMTTGSIIFTTDISKSDGRDRVKLLRKIAQRLGQPLTSLYLEIGNRLRNDVALENGIRMAGPGDRVRVNDVGGFTVTWQIKCSKDIAGDKNIGFLGELSAREDFSSTFKDPVLGWFVHTTEDGSVRYRRAIRAAGGTPVATPGVVGTPTTVSPSPSIMVSQNTIKPTKTSIAPMSTTSVIVSVTTTPVVRSTTEKTTTTESPTPPLVTTQETTTEKATTEKTTTMEKSTTTTEKPTTTTTEKTTTTEETTTTKIPSTTSTTTKESTTTEKSTTTEQSTTTTTTALTTTTDSPTTTTTTATTTTTTTTPPSTTTTPPTTTAASPSTTTTTTATPGVTIETGTPITPITIPEHSAFEMRLDNMFIYTKPLHIELVSFPSGAPQEDKSWIEYDREKLYFLPKNQHIGHHTFGIKGTDNETQRFAISEFSVQVTQDKKMYNYEYNMTITVDVTSSAKRQVELVQSIARASDQDPEKLRAVYFASVEKNTAVIWSLNDNKYLSCRNNYVEKYLKTIRGSDFRDKFDFNARIFEAGMVEKKECQEPTIVVPVKSEGDKLWLNILIPAIVIVVCMLIIALILCCVYRRKRKANVQIEEDKTYLNHKKPVIFLEEFEEKPHFVSLQPLILPNEKPPTPGHPYEPRADTPEGPGSSTTVSTESEEKPLTPQSPKENSRKGYNAPPPYNSL